MSQLPPGPRLSAVQTARFYRDPFRLFRRCAREYGDPFTLELSIGSLVVTGRPEGIREIFSADFDTFEAFGTTLLKPVLGEHSLILMSGPPHRRDRKLLTPPFHGERMRAYGRIIQDVTRIHAAKWEPGRPFLVQDTTQAISLDVILRAVFGITEPVQEAQFREILVRGVASLNPLLIFLPVLQRDLGPGSPGRKFLRAQTAMNELLFAELAARRAQGSEGRDDILSLLLAARDEDGRPMTDEELRDELLTLLMAGHETTGLAMAWALYQVHRHPEVFDALKAELEPLGPQPEPEALAKLPYLGAICQETLRFTPILPIAPRRPRAPFKLLGYEIPATHSLAAGIGLVHFDPEIYPEPDRFRPERFLERQFSPFEYIPFGGGVRKCIGAPFALYEMKIVLGTLMAAHRLSLKDLEVRPVRRNITFGPSRLRMALEA
jgi:cytochrome P450